MNYVVQRGDTIFSIATRFNLPAATILAANRITDPRQIYPGLTLFIPIPRPPVPGPGPGPGQGQLRERIERLEAEVIRLNTEVNQLERRVRRLEGR